MTRQVRQPGDRSDPLTDLVVAIRRDGRPPLWWIARYAPDGDLTAAWEICEAPHAMTSLLAVARLEADSDAAAEAARDARDAARTTNPDELRRILCDAIRRAVPVPPTVAQLLDATDGR